MDSMGAVECGPIRGLAGRKKQDADAVSEAR
jgi:hypothetical protein